MVRYRLCKRGSEEKSGLNARQAVPDKGQNRMSIFKQVKGSGSVTAPEPTHIGRQSRPLRALRTFVARRKVWVIEGKAWVDFGVVCLKKSQTIGD